MLREEKELAGSANLIPAYNKIFKAMFQLFLVILYLTTLVALESFFKAGRTRRILKAITKQILILCVR